MRKAILVAIPILILLIPLAADAQQQNGCPFGEFTLDGCVLCLPGYALVSTGNTGNGGAACFTCAKFDTTQAPPAPGSPVDDCGFLVEDGDQCLYLDSQNSGPLLLGNYGAFGAGDFVHVVGVSGGPCADPCLGGCFIVGVCVDGNSIELCTTGSEEETWGRVKTLFR